MTLAVVAEEGTLGGGCRWGGGALGRVGRRGERYGTGISASGGRDGIEIY